MATSLPSDPRPALVPASSFSIVLGLAGLGNDWLAAAALWRFDAGFAHALFVLTAGVWCVLVVGYAMKWVARRDEALGEVRHPIKCCFVSLVPISGTLVGMGVRTWVPVAGTTMIAAGTAGQLAFSVYRSGGMMRGGRQLADATAVMYLPTVAGNFVSAIALASIGQHDLARCFFGAGMLSWFALESIITNRLYHGEPLPEAIRPTLGIQLAPPVVGSVAYLSVTGGRVDGFLFCLFGYGLLQLFFLVRLSGWFLRGGFTQAFWAFSFGLTAMVLAAVRAAAAAPQSLFGELALPLFVVSNLFILALTVRTVALLIQGRLFAT
jgi:tellurite resistance protein